MPTAGEGAGGLTIMYMPQPRQAITTATTAHTSHERRVVPRAGADGWIGATATRERSQPQRHSSIDSATRRLQLGHSQVAGIARDPSTTANRPR
jgi:hypothetical protein